tara:strand:+ start:86 stop:427 length:342 start_codon:yes stop_codon:yes gene_type:complete
MENSNVELAEILNKLSNIQFDEIGNGRCLLNNEWEVNIQVNFNSMAVKGESRVQLVMYAKYKGGIAVRWGSESVEQNDMIAEWYMIAESKAFKAEMKKQDHDSEVAELMFKSL